MKLRELKGGHGYVTAYNLTIGSKEARDAGFVNEKGERFELKKTVDTENKRIIIELNSLSQPDETWIYISMHLYLILL